MECMRAMGQAFPIIGDVRGLGLLMGMELIRDKTTGERAIGEAEAVMYASLTRGLNFKITMGNILTLTPSLRISESEMDAALEILKDSLAEVMSP
jgi:4-aminobutyrate aminotransferase